MSDYISGQEIIDTYEVLPFEFINRFIQLGLLPANPTTGVTVEVTQFLTAAFNAQEMRNDADPVAEGYKNFIEANSETNWQNFQLSGDTEIDAKIINALLIHIYDKKLYKQLTALDQEIRHGHPEPQPALKAEEKKPSNRTSTIQMQKAIERAKLIWETYPSMHPAELSTYPAFRLQLVMKKEGKQYIDKTYRDWIGPEWPEEYRYDGPPKSLNIPDARIEQMLRDLY